MHTIIVTAVGFVLLGILLATMAPRATGARRFIPVWLVLCIAHLAYGVIAAGYPLRDELLVHSVVFGLPALVAWLLGRKAA